MKKDFSSTVKEILMFSREEAGRLHNTNVGVEHILLGMLRSNQNDASTIIQLLGVDVQELKQTLDREMYREGAYISENQLTIDKSVEHLLRLSLLESIGLNSEKADTEHLLLAMLKDRNSLAYHTLNAYDVDYQRVYNAILERRGINKNKVQPVPQMGATFPEEDDEEEDQFSASKKKEATRNNPNAKNSDTPVIDSFGTDLTRAAEENRLDPIVGRETEIERLA